MNKKYIMLIVLVVLLSFFLVRESNYKSSIIQKDFEIILETNCELSLEVNNLIMMDDWAQNTERNAKIQNLVNIIYESSRRGSNYEIKDKAYLDTFEALNYFEDYLYDIKKILNKTNLTIEDKKYIDDTTDVITQLKKQ
ncbi:MAG: hypothetical protein KAH05_00870 [Clostridiales bacterium]|nr:hypothetical protein [Clostridiales bacterium]